MAGNGSSEVQTISIIFSLLSLKKHLVVCNRASSPPEWFLRLGFRAELSTCRRAKRDREEQITV